jgi:hypothetical protein
VEDLPQTVRDIIVLPHPIRRHPRRVHQVLHRVLVDLVAEILVVEALREDGRK